MDKSKGEPSTSTGLSVVTALLAVLGLIVSCWTAWYVAGSARDDSIRHDAEVAAADCRRHYGDRCDVLNLAVREAIISAQKGAGVDAPMAAVRGRVAPVLRSLDSENSSRLNGLVDELDRPPSSAPLQLLNDHKDETANRARSDDLATQIERLLIEARDQACPPVPRPSN